MNFTLYKLIFFVALTLSIASCSKQAPKCSDENTLMLVKNILIERIIKIESDKEVDSQIKFVYPVATSSDEKIKKLTCEAKVKIGSEYELPISYSSQLDDDNQHIVSVYGLTNGDALSLRLLLNRIIADKQENEKKKKSADTEINVKTQSFDKMDRVEQPDNPLISALKVNRARDGRIGSGESAISYLISLGVINNKPDDRSDYNSHYTASKEYDFYGHKIVGVDYEYMEEYIGCCVNPGIDIILKLSGDKSNLVKFAKINKCEFTIDESAEDVRGYLRCHDRDLISSSAEENIDSMQYKYMQPVTLSGILESAQGIDANEVNITYPSLQINSPITVNGNPNNDDEFLRETEANVSAIQLVISGDELWSKYKLMKGQNVTISCSDLFHQFNGNHFTKVLCTVTKIN